MDDMELEDIIMSDPDFEDDFAEMEAIRSGELTVPGYYSIDELREAALEYEDDE